jgi:hypothetical protein
MSFIAYLLAGLSLVAGPAARAQSDNAPQSGASSTTPQPNQSKPPPDTATSPSQAQEPYHHAKVKKHYDPSHKEANESATMRKRDAINGQGKSSKKPASKSKSSGGASDSSGADNTQK